MSTGTGENPLAEARDVMTGGEPTTGIIEKLATDTGAELSGKTEIKPTKVDGPASATDGIVDFDSEFVISSFIVALRIAYLPFKVFLCLNRS